jgi:hypothetical protein
MQSLPQGRSDTLAAACDRRNGGAMAAQRVRKGGAAAGNFAACGKPPEKPTKVPVHGGCSAAPKNVPGTRQ